VLTVLFTAPTSCGCTEALVEDGNRLVYCAANVCRDGWFCECADPEDLEVCEHVRALLRLMIEAGQEW
jgi:hypothetical protein